MRVIKSAAKLRRTIEAKTLGTAPALRSLRLVWRMLNYDLSLVIQPLFTALAILVLLELVLRGSGLGVFPEGLFLAPDLLTGILIGFSAITAFLAYTRDSKAKKREEAEKAGLQRLELCEKCFEQASSLLCGQNNDRYTWIQAARLLLSAEQLGRGISTPVSREGYDLLKNRCRSQLYIALTLPPKAGEQGRQALPAAFFCGIDDWQRIARLEEAAAKGGARSVVGQPNRNTVFPTPSSNLLETKSVVAVFDFLQWPKGQADLLDEIQEWPVKNENYTDFDQGARHFVEFRKTHLVINGQVIENATKKVIYDLDNPGV